MAVSGIYKLTVNSPRGQQQSTLTLKEEDKSLSGTYAGQMGSTNLSGGTVDGNKVKFNVNINAMGREITLAFDATIDGNAIKGTMNTPMGGSDFTGTKES